MHVVEWTVWGGAALLTLFWSWSLRRVVAQGKVVFMALAVVPMLWFVSLVMVPALGWSSLHLLWLFPLGFLLGMVPPFFPFSLLAYPGELYGRFCCLGLDVSGRRTEEELEGLVDEVCGMLDNRYGPRLRSVGSTGKSRRVGVSGKPGRKTWLRRLNRDDIAVLRHLLTTRGPNWDHWEYRLHSGNIIIYSPAVQSKQGTGQRIFSQPRMVKHLRIVAVPFGPFQLQHMTQAGKWEPIDDCEGELETIVDFIVDDPFGLCQTEDPGSDQPKLKYHPPAG